MPLADSRLGRAGNFFKTLSNVLPQTLLGFSEGSANTMETIVIPPTHCPGCQKSLPAGVLAGLCPACLLAQGLGTETDGAEAGSGFEPPSMEAMARLFPNLEILGLLGVGGMGAVYKARQPVLDRWVALKILPAGGARGADFEERFNREARALARLSHPNIVAVHEFGQVEGLHFFLMEFVDGANLRQLGRAGRLAPREALQLVPQICDALQYAHDEGVVHRDIKPENVLVDRKGRVKIADFGLAKIMGPGQDPDRRRLTAEGQVMGTPHYMAPEQWERPLTVDHRADIYSLGVVFYELLTGDLPLGKFPPPSRKVELDVRLDDIVLRALENDPERRYQQASEVKSGVASVVATPPSAESAAATPSGEMAGGKPAVRFLRWAGIPAVVERDGEREVNFQGAIGVFFVMWMTAALAEQAVRWWSGVDHAMVALGFVTATLTGIWAIRRTLNQPCAGGSRRPGRVAYLRDVLMVVGLFAFVVGLHYLKVRVINPRLGISAVASRPQAPPLQFSPVEEHTFDELIDFDSGRTSTFPPAAPGENPFAGIGESILWAQANGFDAAAGNGELQVLNLTLVPLTNAEWDTLSPDDIVRRLERVSPHPGVLRPPEPGGLPVTFAYRTREMGQGMIQWVSSGSDRPGATVRIKRLAPLDFAGTVAPTEAVLVPQSDGDGPFTVEGVGPFKNLQAALDAAPDNATIRLDEGIHPVDAVIRKRVSLAGHSWERTILVPATAWHAPLTNEVMAFEQRLRNAKSAASRASVLAHGNPLSIRPILRIEGDGMAAIEKIQFRYDGVPPEGEMLSGGVIEIVGGAVVMMDSAIVGSPASGLVAMDGGRLAVSECLVAAAWNTGIQCGSNSSVAVADSDVRNCFFAGIAASQVPQWTVIRSRISGSAWDGIRYERSSPEITDCLIFGNAQSGIHASRETRATVRGNVLFGNAMNGMSCWPGTADHITGNTFYGNLREGLLIIGESSPVVSSNIFESNPVAVFQGRNGAERLGQPRLSANLSWRNETNWVGAAPWPDGPTTPEPVGTFGLRVDPGLANPAGNDFALRSDSAALAAGIGAVSPPAYPGPYPLQPAELRMIPEGSTRDYRQWKRLPQP